jgi:hypothetical protein
MEPTTDHERAIALGVDARFLENLSNDYTIIRDVAESLDFVMSASDSQFLVRYVHWRSIHPKCTSNYT